MKKKLITALLTIFLTTSLSYSLDVLTKVHPGYNLTTIRPSTLHPQATGLTFMPDGRLIYTNYRIGFGHNYNMDGEIITLSGLEKNDPEQVVVDTFATGFKDPMGLWTIGDSVYVLARDEFSLLYDSDKDGKADVRQVIMKDWTKGDRMWSYGPVYYDGYFYLAHGVDMNLKIHGKSTNALRGCMLKVAPDGTYEVFAAGLRQPDGIAVNPVGEIFMVDGQGQWLPSCKLIHIQKGRYYGHPQIYFSATPWDESIPESPPAIWLPHREIGLSNSQPVFLDTGLYRGQLLAADITYGGIQRYFLEKVKGEYQGAIFQFTGGLECGMNTTQIGPDGAIYTGGIGDGGRGVGAWGWNNTRWGLQKLVPNGKIAFEMLAIRSLVNGFEIEFTKAPGPNALLAANYTIKRGGFSPVAIYGGGNMVGRKTIGILSVTPGGANTVIIRLDPNDLLHDPETLLKSTCFHFSLKNITSKIGEEPLWSEEAWYTLNAVGPADKVGCMDQGYAEYEADAVYDDGFRCLMKKTDVFEQQQTSTAMLKNLTINRITSGHLTVTVPFAAHGKLSLTNMEGVVLKSFQTTGAGEYTFSMSDFPRGVYILQVEIKNTHAGKPIVWH